VPTHFLPLLGALLLAPAAFAQDAPTEPAAETTTEAAPGATADEIVTAADPLNVWRSANEEDAKVSGESSRTVWIGGQTVSVDAIAPDLFAAGETLTVTGEVLDNLVGAGREIRVEGPVGGDAFLFGETLTVTADVGGDVYAAGESLRIPEGVRVGGNVYFGGADLTLDGDVGGSVLGGGANFTIGGDVGGDVKVEAASLSVGPGASIGGTLEYTSPDEGTIAADATVGAIDWTQKVVDVDADSGDGGLGFGIGFTLLMLLGSLLTGGALLALFPRALTQPAALLQEEAPVALGIGFAVLVGVPVLALILALFVLPIPLSLFALAVWVPASVLARFVAAYALGHIALTQMGKAPTPLGALMLGLVTLQLAYAIPFVGSFTMFVATVLGMGALFLAARRAGEAQAA